MRQPSQEYTVTDIAHSLAHVHKQLSEITIILRVIALNGTCPEDADTVLNTLNRAAGIKPRLTAEEYLKSMAGCKKNDPARDA